MRIAHLLLLQLLLSIPTPAPALFGQSSEGPLQLESPLGRALHANVPTAEQQAAIDEARAALDPQAPTAEQQIALGRALSAVWRYRDAIAAYTAGLDLHPEHAMLYRHRGHRYISLRDFGRAVTDLERAADLDDDSFDIWYHLGLARYLNGDFAGAADAYAACAETVDDDDGLVAVTHWRYMALRRAGEHDAARALLAPISAEMDIQENGAYHQLLLMYQAQREPDALLAAAESEPLELATTGYGIGNWKLYQLDDEAEARALFERIVDSPYWPAFGFIAAETELARASTVE